MLKVILKNMIIQHGLLFSVFAHANNTVNLNSNLVTDWDPYIDSASEQETTLKHSKNHSNIDIDTKQKNSALSRHVQFFAEKNEELNTESMKPPHDQLGISKNVKYKMQAILNMLDRRELPHNSKNLITIFNPASSGIWDANGNFNEEKFNELSATAVFNNGHQVITKEIFQQFLYSMPKNGSEKETAATVTIIWPFKINISWERVTEGSVDELFEYLADTTIINYSGKPEKAFTVDALRQFYELSDVYMQKMIDTRTDGKYSAIKDCPYTNNNNF